MNKYQKQLKNIGYAIKALLILDAVMVIFSNRLCIYYLPLLILNSLVFSISLLRGMDITNEMKRQHRHN